MKKILGLDLGTNSIGWALIDQDFDNKQGKIVEIGTRIIPMSQDILGKFDNGVSISQTAERTGFRGVRRLRERHLLRRERLHRVLHILKFLPEHYDNQIDFKNQLGQFKKETEPKLVYDENKQFIFKKSFEEMVAEFKKAQPELFYINENGRETLIPYDWTIYYLRKKALTEKIEKEELAWLILNFNQKRGYYQLRGEDDDEIPNKKVEFHSLKVIDIIADEQQKGKAEIWYNIILENNWIYRRASKLPLFDWKNKIKEFVVTTDLNDDGSEKTDKDGKIKRSFRAPSETDWTLIKTKTEQTIDKSNKTVGQYIYDTLLENPTQKINGKLVRVIERKFYKAELEKILITQQQFHPELIDDSLYNLCIQELYEHNEAHRNNIAKRNVHYLFLNDIIFYQRPLKSKKSLITDCKFENRKYIKDGIEQHEILKCIPKSHPLFQEFRLWQWIKNLHIFERENDNFPITEQLLKSEDDYVNLFDFLNNRKDIEQKALLKYFKLNEKTHRWNFVEDKAYPSNETRTLIVSKLSKCENIPIDFLNNETEEALWHILYSVNDKLEIEKALYKFASKHGLKTDFVEQFKKFPPYKNEYGSYSSKAIKKLLPLMRMGKYWKEAYIHEVTRNRIEKIINAEFDENIRNRVREKSINLSSIHHFKGLPLWLVNYIVYDRHAEDSNIEKWKTPTDINDFLKAFKQHSLRNPIVEQVITETLRVVKDIWSHYGDSSENFFDEIHIELGREMKNPADKRKKMTETISVNENTNLRIKALLAEMQYYNEVENVRPYSPYQQEILKIYEDGVLNSGIEIEDEILKISKTAQPSKTDLLRYKLWLEQKYRSPYTGEMIPLNKLFTPAYEIEHIIPQKRYFDDSFSNKVICESEIT
jgi:CRISPR-associated endonuclease Csn1